MANSGESFHAFEQAGWDDASTVTGYHEHLSGLTTQCVDALLDAAHVSAGLRVLDAATGAGYVAGAAARCGADPIGMDFSVAQVRLARQTQPGVRFEQGDAQALALEPDTFDALVNAFGMCHLPNPALALSEAFRVLKSGPHVAFSVWDVPERAVGFGAVDAAVRAHGSMDVGLPVGPNFLLFSDPEQSIKALVNAGFVSPSCRQVPQVWRIADPDRLFDMVTEGTVRAAVTLRAQSPMPRQSIRAGLRETVASYKRGDTFEVPMPAAIASAVKA